MQKVQELYVRMLVALQSAQKGQGLVEYALIIVLVSIAAIVTLGLLGTEVTEVFSRITSTLNK